MGSISDVATGAVNDVVQGVGDMASNLSKSLKALRGTEASMVATALRKTVLPLGGSAFKAAIVQFLGPEDANDWRVRLSIPFNFFMGSKVFEPLVDAGGFIFPYTPTVTFGATANYDDMQVVHQNYAYSAYQNSKPADITIDGPFHVEDENQALYWLACIHFLRSVTKMHSGDTSSHGSPPPVLTLHGYGDFVFKNVPVVVTSFSVTLGNDCDYIQTTAQHGMNFSWQSLVPTIFMGTIDTGNLIGGFASGLISEGLNAVGMSSNKAHVPTKSTISVTLRPVYSRESVKQFSLQAFVNGSYVTGGFI